MFVTFGSLVVWGAISHERSGLSFASQSAVFSHLSVHKKVFTSYMFNKVMYIQYIQGVCQCRHILRINTCDQAMSKRNGRKICSNNCD
jgi:hypothetical protein